MRVLLVEDDRSTAQSIELMLKSEDFNVYVTGLGEEGIELAKLYDYDIIVLDLNLPDMSGYEVLRTLRVTKVKTPILILSGLAGIEDKVKGLGFGADDYLTKPFHKDEMVARIHAIVRRWGFLMPIRAEVRWLYPLDWLQLSAVIRFERAKRRCEICGRPHGQIVRHLGDGRWWD